MLEALRRGFEILLGRSLDSFHHRYELWFVVDSELLPEQDQAASLDQLVDGQSAPRDPEASAFWLRYGVDYSRSLFVFDPQDLEDAAPELVTALQARHHALTGEELARVVADGGLERTEVLSTCWYVCRRAVTDRSIVGAMVAATLSSAAPNGLLSRARYGAMADRIRFEPRWETALAAIDDDVIREHLLMSCVDTQTARWAGAWLDPQPKPDSWLEPVTHRGGEIISIWHSGEGQASRAVVRFER